MARPRLRITALLLLVALAGLGVYLWFRETIPRPWPFDMDPPEGVAIVSAGVGLIGSVLLLLRFSRTGALWASNLTYLASTSAFFELGIARWHDLSRAEQMGVWLLLVFIVSSFLGALRLARQSSGVHTIMAGLSIVISCIFFFVVFA